jgi:hypothetical protein
MPARLAVRTSTAYEHGLPSTYTARTGRQAGYWLANKTTRPARPKASVRTVLRRAATEAANLRVPVRISPDAQHGDIISPKAKTYPPFPSQSAMARAVADTDDWTGAVRSPPARPAGLPAAYPRPAPAPHRTRLCGRCARLHFDRWDTVTQVPPGSGCARRWILVRGAQSLLWRLVPDTGSFEQVAEPPVF